MFLNLSTAVPIAVEFVKSDEQSIGITTLFSISNSCRTATATREVSTTLLLESKVKYEEVVAVPCDKEAKFIVDAVTAPRTNNLEPLNLVGSLLGYQNLPL